MVKSGFFRFQVLAEMELIEKVWFCQNDWISFVRWCFFGYKSPLIKALKARPVSAQIIALKARFISAMGVAHGADKLFPFPDFGRNGVNRENIGSPKRLNLNWRRCFSGIKIPFNQSAEGEAYISWNHSAEGAIYNSHGCSLWLR